MSEVAPSLAPLPLPGERLAVRRAHLTASARSRTNRLPVLSADSFRPLSRGWHYSMLMDPNAKETTELPYAKTSISWRIGDEGKAPPQMMTSALAKQVGDAHDCPGITKRLNKVFADLGAVRCPQRVFYLPLQKHSGNIHSRVHSGNMN